MKKIKFLPSEKEIEVQDDETVLAAAFRAEVYVHTVCGGKASCAECKVRIISGEEHLTPMEYDEKKLLGNVFHVTRERLSCQICLETDGEVVVDTEGHRPLTQDEVRERKNAKFKKRFMT